MNMARSKILDLMPGDQPQTIRPLTFTAEGELYPAITQTLNRVSNGVCLRRKAFESSLEDWSRVPLIFAQDHPDPRAYDKDPAAELARIKGRLVKGTASKAEIVKTGHPTLRLNFMLQDQEIQQGIEQGQISTSNGMIPEYDQAKRLIGVQPHHILFFREDGKTVPGDAGVLIMKGGQQPHF